MVATLSPLSLFASKILLLETLLGTVMNLGVFWALTRTKSWFNASNVLYFNLFFCDTVLCLWDIFMSSIHVFGSTEWFFDNWCQMGGYIAQTMAGISFVTVLYQTLNPFIVIVLGWPSLSGKQMTMLVIGLWVFVCGTAPFIYIEGDGYVPQSSMMWCQWNFASTSTWTHIVIVINLLVIAGSPFIMIGAYTLIWIQMRHQTSNTNSNRVQWNVVRTGSYFIVSTIVIWIVPFRTMVLQFVNKAMGPEIDDVLFILIGTLPSVFNSVIFVAVRSEVRQNIFRIFEPDYVAISYEETTRTDPFMMKSTKSSKKEESASKAIDIHSK